MVDRLLNVSSLLLVVLSLIFTQFMAASNFWYGRVMDLDLKLTELKKNPGKESRGVIQKKFIEEIEKKKKDFDKEQEMQAKYARIFAAFMGILLLFVAFCFPIEKWTCASTIVRWATVFLVVALVAMAIVGFLYAGRIWEP